MSNIISLGAFVFRQNYLAYVFVHPKPVDFNGSFVISGKRAIMRAINLISMLSYFIYSISFDNASSDDSSNVGVKD